MLSTMALSSSSWRLQLAAGVRQVLLISVVMLKGHWLSPMCFRDEGRYLTETVSRAYVSSRGTDRALHGVLHNQSVKVQACSKPSKFRPFLRSPRSWVLRMLRDHNSRRAHLPLKVLIPCATNTMLIHSN